MRCLPGRRRSSEQRRGDLSPGLDLETRGGRTVRRRGEREREKRAEDGRHHCYFGKALARGHLAPQLLHFAP